MYDWASESGRAKLAAAEALCDATGGSFARVQQGNDGGESEPELDEAAVREFLASGVPAASRGEAAQLQLAKRQRYEARLRAGAYGSDSGGGGRFEWYQETLALPPAPPPTPTPPCSAPHQAGSSIAK
jgi:hypothetical protein